MDLVDIIASSIGLLSTLMIIIILWMDKRGRSRKIQKARKRARKKRKEFFDKVKARVKRFKSG